MTEDSPVQLDDSINFRLDHRIHQQMTDLTAKLPKKYENESHFIRCAILRLLKEEELGLWKPITAPPPAQ